MVISPGLAQFLMSLHVRNPARVEQITLQAAEALRESLSKDPEEYEAVRKSGDPSTLVGWVERYAPALIDNYGKSILPGIVTHQLTGNEIIRMHWGVLGGSGASPNILTCDRPLYLSHGINDSKWVIALPLSTRTIFLASRDQVSLDKLITMESSALINSINQTIVTQAERNVYGAHNGALSFVEHCLAPVVSTSVTG